MPPPSTRILVGTYSAGYSLSSSYTDLRIEGSASITGTTGADGGIGANGSDGGIALSVGFYATTHNAGLITGGAGGAGGDSEVSGNGGQGGTGGYGAMLAGGLFVNTATVTGGAGGSGGQSAGGYGGNGANGGVGLKLTDGTAINDGFIGGGVGGAGGAGALGYGGGGSGGFGVVLTQSQLTNLGTISGGAGGVYGSGRQASGGAGIECYMSNVINGSLKDRSATIEGFAGAVELGGYVTNFGTVQGQLFGAAAVQGDIFNNGLIFGDEFGAAVAEGGLVVNGSSRDHAATIIGMDVGFYSINDTLGTTVVNYGVIMGPSGTSILFGNAADRLVVEAGSSLAGVAMGHGGTLEFAAGKGRVTGFGSEYSDFGAYQIDGGGNWIVTGANTMAAGLDVNQFARLQVGAGLSASETTPPVNWLTIDGAVANSGMLLATGGTLTVEGAVTGAGAVVIDGGTVEFESSFSQNVRFSPNGGELILADSQAFSSRVFGFSTQGQSALDLLDISYESPSFILKAHGGVVSLSDGTHSVTLHFAGDFSGVTWGAADDGVGGVVLTATTPPKPSASAFVAAMAAVNVGSAPSAWGGAAASRLSPAPLLAPGR